MKESSPERQRLREMLVDQEGTGPIENGRYMVYADSLGYNTVGVGRLVSRGFSEDEILLMLDNDIDECILDLAQFEWFRNLDRPRQMAIISLRFNLGPSRFRKWGPTLSFIERGDFAGASRQFLSNKRYISQVGRRAAWIARVLETGEI